jgi:hypothetical protein
VAHDQIAKASSSTATATRRCAGSSTASSYRPRRRFCTNPCPAIATLALWSLWVRKGHSCGSPVLMQKAAEQVTSTHHALFALADDGQPGRSVRRLKLERPVRPMGVVVLEIHPKDLRQMATSYNQQPVQAWARTVRTQRSA